MSSLQARISQLLAQEALLQFSSFSADDAWELGCMLVEAARARQVQPTFAITVNGYTVFRYGFPGTNLHNEHWLRRKCNTVTTTHMSSLRAGLQLQLAGEDPLRDWCLSPQDYAFLGGGFPLILRGTGVIGAVCCSGLPHECDHGIVVETIAKYLSVELPGGGEENEMLPR